MLEFILLVLAIAALVSAQRVGRRVGDIERRLQASEAKSQNLAGIVDRLARGQSPGSQSPSGQSPSGQSTRAGEGQAPSAEIPWAPQDTPPTTPRLPQVAPPTATRATAASVPSEPGRTARISGSMSGNQAGGTGTGSVPPLTPPPSAGAAASPGSTPPPSPSLEERLGTRWAVWVGGLALALGGLLLVRYSIEQGYFGPGLRVTMGLLFAAALMAAGEWFRRGEHDLGLSAIPSAHIPGVLTAAGSSSAFATIYAAYALYDFLTPAAAFVLLGIVGVGTMLAAALHGPVLGGLGLVGSYAAPMLVSTAKPNPWPLMLYLAVVAATAMGLARVRQWLWLAGLAVIGGFFWGMPFIERIDAGAAGWMAAGYLHTLVQLGLAGWFLCVVPNLGTPQHEARIDPVATGALSALSLLAVLMLIVSLANRTLALQNLATAIPFAILAAAILGAVAWTTSASAVAAILAGVVLLAVAAMWPGLKVPPPASQLVPDLTGFLTIPDNIASYIVFTSLAALAVLAVVALRLWRSPTLRPEVAAVCAIGGIATPLLALIVAYLRVTQFDRSISFACAGAVLAAIFVGLADRFQRREIAELPGTRLVTGAFAAAAIAAFALGLTAYLERGYLTVAFALAALGTAYVATSRDIALLRHAVTALGLLVLARIAWNPRIMGADVGQLPVLNWLLVGYGIPALSFFAAARLLERKTEGLSARISDALAVIFTGLLGYFQVRHAIHGGNVLSHRSTHVEQGLLAVVSLGLSYALLKLDLARHNPVFRFASIAFGVVSALFILAGLGLAHNPLLVPELVGGRPIASTLMLAYLPPGIAAIIVARASRGLRPSWYVTGIASLAALLLFAYATLEVRHVFQGDSIRFFRHTTSAEFWTYSAVWLALGIAFLGYGIVRGSFEARLASAMLVVLSVLKVFLLDIKGLGGIWRPLSFIVLGLVLIGIGLVYQRLMFGKPHGTPDPTAAAADNQR